MYVKLYDCFGCQRERQWQHNDSTVPASFRRGESHVCLLCTVISSSLSSAILLSNSNIHVFHYQSKKSSKEMRAAWQFLIKWAAPRAHVGKHYQNGFPLFWRGAQENSTVYCPSLSRIPLTFHPLLGKAQIKIKPNKQPTDIQMVSQAALHHYSLFFSHGNKVFLNLSHVKYSGVNDEL